MVCRWKHEWCIDEDMTAGDLEDQDFVERH